MDWVKNDNRRILHFVYSVGDLDKTIKYTYLIQQVYIWKKKWRKITFVILFLYNKYSFSNAYFVQIANCLIEM